MADQGRGLILAIDTVAQDAAVALVRDGLEVARYAWRIRETASLELLAAIDQTLRDAQVERTALVAVAVDAGPGQYGGLRTGVATAQGLALALGVPLAGIGRLEADAHAHLGSRPVVAVHDAGRSGIAWAAFQAGPGAMPRVLVEPRLDPPSAVAQQAPRGARWCGEVTEVLRQDVERVSGETLHVEPPDAGARAVALVALAAARQAFGDPAGVDAVYLRPPSITRPKTAT